LFEARAIQAYILDGGRLSDMTGASERVDALCGSLLDGVIERLSLDPAAFMRRTSGAFYYLSTDQKQIHRFRDAWSLLVPGFAPGLEWVHCIASGNTVHEAVEAGFPLLAQARNQPAATLPEAGPFAERATRTGLAATGRFGKRGQPELVDLPTLRKRESINGDDARGHSTLARKFLPVPRHASALMRYHFPRNLEAEPGESDPEVFPFQKDQRDIAVIHVDGNGMGIVLRELKAKLEQLEQAKYVARYRAFSEAVGKATLAAAREATHRALLPNAVPRRGRKGREFSVVPARPLVLGGDDLSIIVRADLALDFVSAFISAFERETKAELSKRELFDQGLTACAGVAFIKASQPFAQAYALAECLCQHAKQQAATAQVQGQGQAMIKPSAVAFYRVTTSYFDDYASEILDRAEVVEENGESYRLTYGAYALGDSPLLAKLENLLDLCGFLDKPEIARGTARTLLMSLHQSPSVARKQYERWRELMAQGHNDALQCFDTCLQALKVDAPEQTHFRKLDDAHLHATPLGDAVSLMAVGGHRTTKGAKP
jgi:hypothetical protein